MYLKCFIIIMLRINGKTQEKAELPEIEIINVK